MYVERYGHVDAWVASTPIADKVAGLQQALPAVIRRRPDGAPQRFLVSLAARLNPVRAITLAKYERQFGADGIHGALRVLKAVGPVDLARIEPRCWPWLGPARMQSSAGRRTRCIRPSGNVDPNPG